MIEQEEIEVMESESSSIVEIVGSSGSMVSMKSNEKVTITK